MSFSATGSSSAMNGSLISRGNNEIGHLREGLFDNLMQKKKSKEVGEQTNNKLLEHLSRTGYEVGKALSKGDCFFDSLYQALEHLQIAILLEHQGQIGYKKLRQICDKYAKQYKNVDGHWLKKLILEKNPSNPQQYDDYLATIQFTASEMDKMYEEKIFRGIAIWGDPHIDGRIICNELDVEIHTIEMMYTSENEVAFRHEVVNKLGTKEVTGKEIDELYKNNKIIHMAVFQGTLHYVPLIHSSLKAKNDLASTGQPSQPTQTSQISQAFKAWSETQMRQLNDDLEKHWQELFQLISHQKAIDQDDKTATEADITQKTRKAQLKLDLLRKLDGLAKKVQLNLLNLTQHQEYLSLNPNQQQALKQQFKKRTEVNCSRFQKQIQELDAIRRDTDPLFLPDLKPMLQALLNNFQVVDIKQNSEDMQSKPNAGNFLKLSPSGLFSEVELNKEWALQDHSVLSSEHQKLIDDYLYRHYYQKNKIESEAWCFGFFNYTESICCGRLYKNTDLLTLQNGCPHCATSSAADTNGHFFDQLFCMYMRLSPHTQRTQETFIFQTLREKLTLQLLRMAVLKKRYFLLSHLLRIMPIAQFINWYDEFGKTLLHYALEKNDVIAALILIKHGTDVNAIVLANYFPIDYLVYLQKCGSIRGDTNPLQEVLLQYGSYSHLKNNTNINATGQRRPPNTYEGNVLHNACRNTNEFLTYELINNGFDVNLRNRQNYTPLQTLAYFGLMNENGFAVSTLNLYCCLKKLGKNETKARFLEILLTLHEEGFLSYNYAIYTMEPCAPQPELSTNLEIFNFLKSYGIARTYITNNSEFHRLLLLNNKKLNKDSSERTSVYLHVCQNKEMVLEAKSLLECLNCCVKSADTPKVKLVFLPAMQLSPVVMLMEVNTLEKKLSINITSLVELPNDDPRILFLEELKTKITNLGTYSNICLKKNHIPLASSNPEHPKLNRFLTLVKHIFEVMEEAFLENTIRDAYFQFRIKKNVFLKNNKENIKMSTGLFNLFKPIQPEKLKSLLTFTKQDYMVEALFPKTIVNISLLDPNQNLFCFAESNYSFMKKLVELGVDPFPPQSTSSLIKKLPYYVGTVYSLLLYYKNIRDPKSTALEIYVRLIDGSTTVDRARGWKTVNCLEWLIKDRRELLEEVNADGETAVFSAIHSKNFNAIQVLIDAGASLLVKNKNGKFPIDIKFGRDPIELSIQTKIIQETSRQAQEDIKRKMGSEKLKKEDLDHLSKYHNIVVTKPLSSHFTFTFVPSLRDKDEEDGFYDAASDYESEDGNEEGMQNNRERNQNKNNIEELFQLVQQNPQQLQPQLERHFNKFKLINVGSYSSCQDFFTRFFSSITFVLQLIDCMSNINVQKLEKKSEKDALRILTEHLSNTEYNKTFPTLKIQLLKQILITIGSVEETRKTMLLGTLADFLRKMTLDDKENREMSILGFLCDSMLNNHEMLAAYTQDKIIIGTIEEANTKPKEFMKEHCELFIKYAHQMGICCFSAISAKKIFQNYLPAASSPTEMPPFSLTFSPSHKRKAAEDLVIENDQTAGNSNVPVAGTSVNPNGGNPHLNVPSNEEYNQDVSKAKRLKTS